MVGKPFRDTTSLGANHDSNAIQHAIQDTDSMVREDVGVDGVVDLDEVVGSDEEVDLGEEAGSDGVEGLDVLRQFRHRVHRRHHRRVEV